MAEKNFVDYVKIHCRSGDGGPGAIHFHREKFNAKGGPDGGEGGRGGHVIIKGNKQMWTLLHLKYRKHIKADHGTPGGASLKTGAYGDDVYLEVPIGTIIKDAETGDVLFEVSKDGEEHFLAKGGRGGKGNAHFKSSINQTPKYAQPGEEGVEGWRILELKVLADVGLVGFPNAGKSTLLASISAAKPKIGSYAFTTLVPNLGIVSYRNNRSFIMADIPGIIENAHEGKGLGIRFLRHIERNSVLLFLIPADSEDINKSYEILRNELKMYNPELLDKPHILGISKSDLIDDELQTMIESEIKIDLPTCFFSAISQKGINELKDLIWKTMMDQSGV